MNFKNLKGKLLLSCEVKRAIRPTGFRNRLSADQKLHIYKRWKADNETILAQGEETKDI
jgi:hypothetical protein